MEIESLAAALEHEHHEIDEGLAALAATPWNLQPLTRAVCALCLHIYLEEAFVFTLLRDAEPGKVPPEAAGRLAEAPTAVGADELAEELAGMLAGQLAMENDVLFLMLLASPDTDLPTLLADMHRRTEQARQPGPAEAVTAADPAGQCRCGCCGRSERHWSGPGRRTKARDLPPTRRRKSIYAAYRAIAPGSGFVLVNDQHPKPLRYHFVAEHAGQFTWGYFEEGPRTWRVQIGRPLTVPPSGPGGTGGAACQRVRLLAQHLRIVTRLSLRSEVQLGLDDQELPRHRGQVWRVDDDRAEHAVREVHKDRRVPQCVPGVEVIGHRMTGSRLPDRLHRLAA